MKTLRIFSIIALLACVEGRAATVEAVKGGASAKTAQSLPPGSNFTTKKSSQGQIRLDKGFVRLGSNSQLQVGKEEQVNLQQGVMMVGSDGAKKRGTVKVTAPGYQFQVQGTALIAYQPGSYIKITVLEGRIRVALQSLLGEFITLNAGQMLVINPADNRLPDPVEVDLNRLVMTSTLTAGSLGPPPTDPFIQSSISEQSGDLNGGFITQTPFALKGASPEVTVFQLVNDLDDTNAIVQTQSYIPPDNNFTTLSNTTITRRGAKAKTLEVNLRSIPEDDGSTTLPSVSGIVTVDPDVFGASPQKLRIVADDTLLVMPGADLSTPVRTSLELNARALDIQNASLKAGSGTQPSETLTLVAYGRDSTREFDLSVNQTTMEAGAVTMNGAKGGGQQRIGIDQSSVTAPKGITLGKAAAPSTITVRNSSELAAMAGSIQFDSGGKAILVDNSILRANATSGQIVLDAGEAGGMLTLRNANLNADVIKARGHSASGDAVIIDGGSFVARTVLKFYAAGASMLRFRGNVVIDSPSSILSASVVRVDPGGSVRSTGLVDIFVNPSGAQFNQGGFGTIRMQTQDIPGGLLPNVTEVPVGSPLGPAF
ncbi:MAG: FecR domain-containing protein [Verrucomicrobia bacterium]|nr:FecR domain-containing protein [Verrucomicrobiota bacterium]